MDGHKCNLPEYCYTETKTYFARTDEVIHCTVWNNCEILDVIVMSYWKTVGNDWVILDYHCI